MVQLRHLSYTIWNVKIYVYILNSICDLFTILLTECIARNKYEMGKEVCSFLSYSFNATCPFTATKPQL